ncbi:hypothetical protein LTR66_003941 [Elasticomyces elasticus]|nr:hypothetical protein LTR66_003941 [Elasticomyces elasticus]
MAPPHAQTRSGVAERMALARAATDAKIKKSRHEEQAKRNSRLLKINECQKSSSAADGSEIAVSQAPGAQQRHLAVEPVPPVISISSVAIPRRSSATKHETGLSSSPASPTNTMATNGASATEGMTNAPEWYKKLKFVQKPSDANAENILRSVIKDLPEKIRKRPTEKAKLFTEIRDRLHKLVFIDMNKEILRKARVFHDDGLVTLFKPELSNGIEFPFDIKADAQELYRKWYNQIFDTYILRGIELGKPGRKDQERQADRIQNGYPGRVYAYTHGHNDLVNGQWFPTQLCTVRDGAHGATQGGIYGLPGKGAFSIVLAGGTHYQDRDLGDRIAYCGTDSENGEITPHTQRMMESVNKHPVRVIRSHTLSSEYAPIEGFRYDGLYDVVGFSLVDQSKQTHVFEMVRQEGQDPIRSRELGLAARPTQQEIAAVVNDKKLRGYRDRDKVSKREVHIAH